MRLGVQLVTLNQSQAPNRRDEAECIEQEEHGDTAGGDDEASQAGAHDARQIKEREAQGCGVGQVLAPDQLDDKRLARRLAQAVREPEQQRQDIHVPELDGSGGDQRPEEQSLGHGRRSGPEQDAPFGPAIGKDPADEREEQHRQRLQRTHQTELEGAMGQLQHQPGLTDDLHPGAGQRDQLAKPEKAEVAMA
jgi:hypothetical protein